MTGRAFVLGLFFAAVFAWFTVLRENRPPYEALTATNIPVLPYALLVVSVLVINPLVKFLRLARVFSRVELLVIFLMGMVSNGIVSYGLQAQLVPLVAGPSSRFNHPGVRWNVYVEPYLNEDFYLVSKGSSKAAASYRDADAAAEKAKSVLKAAQDLTVCREDQQRAQEALDGLVAPQGQPQVPETVRQGYERKLRIAQRQYQQAEKAWQVYAAANVEREVIATFGEKIKLLDVEKAARKEALAAIKKPATDFVSEFEKGFAPEKRAIPGFIYITGEGWESYSSRFERMVKGRKAFAELYEADCLLARARQGEGLDVAAVDAALGRAIVLLEHIGDMSQLAERKAAFSAKQAELDAIRAKEQSGLKDLQERGYYAKDRDIASIEKQTKATTKRIELLDKQILKLTEAVKAKIDPEATVRGRAVAVLETARSIRAEVGTAKDIPALRGRLAASLATFRSFDASLRRFLVGDIQWSVWAKPLFNWSLIVFATYIVLMSLNVLIFRQWAHNEKLIYPLAELPLIMAGADDVEQKGVLPLVFKSGLFWTGFCISAVILGWNHLADARIIANISPISLDYKWGSYVDGSVFNALKETRFKIIFSVIGLTFLVPAGVSYSMWFWQVLCMVELLVMVWLGMGQSRDSFQYHFTYLMNYQTAQGGGALIVFASVILWKCRKYLLSAFSAQSVAGLDPSERSELRVSSALFLAGSVALVAMFTLRLNVNIFYSVIMYLLLLVLTIGLVRAVAEGGVLGTQAFFNPFHFIRHVFGMDKAWNSPVLMAPLWIFVAMMYVDIKSFIAPAMANAMKLRDDMRINRLKFHGAVWASILAAMAVGFAVHLILAYSGGTGKMSGWHYSGGVQDQMGFGFIQRMMEEKPVDVAGVRWWMLAGASIMVMVILLRQQFNWITHPIGLIMCINPMMFLFWGSMFIGWCFKSLVSKYGNRETYQRLRYLAVGLIVGELFVAVLGWHRFDFW